jgi:hypothetical protein
MTKFVEYDWDSYHDVVSVDLQSMTHGMTWKLMIMQGVSNDYCNRG